MNKQKKIFGLGEEKMLVKKKIVQSVAWFFHFSKITLLKIH
jgi:hypothetical protein